MVNKIAVIVTKNKIISWICYYSIKKYQD